MYTEVSVLGQIVRCQSSRVQCVRKWQNESEVKESEVKESTDVKMTDAKMTEYVKMTDMKNCHNLMLDFCV